MFFKKSRKIKIVENTIYVTVLGEYLDVCMYVYVYVYWLLQCDCI